MILFRGDRHNLRIPPLTDCSHRMHSNDTNEPRRKSTKGRLALSSRGQSAAADYRSAVARARGRGPSPRAEFEAARSEWAHAHGLEPDDGAYLGELRARALSLNELGEGLAICGQTREMISVTTARLREGGLLVPNGDAFHARPTREAAQGELTRAQHEFEVVASAGWQPDADALRHATSRVAAALRWLTSFPGAAATIEA